MMINFTNSPLDYFFYIINIKGPWNINPKLFKLRISMVPEAGVEPAPVLPRWILSLWIQC
ncbi:MAG: hypothetical protein K0R54_2782 [Clostridiaceae bacterium]|jgi:hypothetical protein|nr:hypothetical protein [Clostridiaceae bacterium]